MPGGGGSGYRQIARSAGRVEDGRLAVKAEDAAVDVGLVHQDAGVVDQITGREVVRAVDDDVVGLEDVADVFRGESCLVKVELDVGVDGGEVLASRLELWAADVGGGVQNLPLEVGVIDDVEIDQSDSADASSGQVESQRRAQTAGTDQEDAGGLEALLAGHRDLGHDEVAAVAQDFFGRKANGVGSLADYVCERHQSGFPRPEETQRVRLIVILA